MTKAYLLIVSMLLPTHHEDRLGFVFRDPRECHDMGVVRVERLLEEQRTKGGTQGSVWFRCEEVTGGAVLPAAGAKF